MALWTIKSVGEKPREWTNQKGGKMLSYKLSLSAKDEQPKPPRDQATYGQVELVQKPETAPPKPGDELDGDVEVREYQAGGEKRESLKFKKAQRGGAGGGGGGRGWQPRIDDDPVVYAGKQAAIAAQTSLERATELVIASNKPADTKAAADLVIEVAEKYEDHIQSRAKAAGERVRNAGKEK